MDAPQATAVPPPDREIEARVIGKISRRLVSFIFVLFILSSIDRVNVSFAALQMNSHLGFTPQQYGFAVGIFFVTYLAFQIPSAMLGRRFGVRRWMALMLVVWGLGAAGLGFISNLTEFSALRLVIGLAEAGFAPLTLYYYSCWIPKRFRGRVTSKNVVAIAVSIVIGAPLSGWLIAAFDNHLGLAGWQWMFIVEGIPTVLLGVFTLWYLPNHPKEAAWLTPAERAWLDGELAKDGAELSAHGVTSLPAVMVSWRVWACVGAWFSLTMGVYGVIFWLPQAIKQLSGLGPLEVGVLSALPWVAAIVGIVYNARHSDRTGERHWHTIVPALVGGLGLVASVSVGHGAAAYGFLIVGLLGLGSAQAVYWTIPMGFMTGAAAAGGMALINLFGNTAGLIGPNLIGWMRATTGGFSSVGYMLGGFLVLGAACLLPLRPRAARAEAGVPGDAPPAGVPGAVAGGKVGGHA